MKAMKKYLPVALGVATVILELLPYGAVLNFAQPPESAVESLTYFYSYFDPTPYGYANFGPFLTAILTVAILILSVVCLFSDKRGLRIARTVWK